MDAHFLKGILGQEGIEAVVEGDVLEEVRTLPLTSTSLPSVWVADGDVERAKPIVEDYNRRHIENNNRPEGAKPGNLDLLRLRRSE